MKFTPYILLIVGLFLVFLEFFVPGGIVGAIGGVVLIVSIVFFALNSTSALWTIVYTLSIFVFLAFIVKYALWRIKHGKVKGIFLNTIQEGYFASEFPKELIGKEGEALSDLKPSGHIQIEGKRYQALSKMGYIVKGTKVKVIGGQGAHVIVIVIEGKKR